MPTSRTASTDGVRRRPKDRKAQIARVAAEAFSARGYHAVGMDDIAAVLDISATALYRHYANKYDMFRAAVLTLGQQLVDATNFCDEPSPNPDEEDTARLQARIVDAIVDVALANRDSAGLYRWEGRYLEGDDQAALMAQIRLVNRRIQIPLRRRRPALTSSERWTLSSAAMSVMGSIADHRFFNLDIAPGGNGCPLDARAVYPVVCLLAGHFLDQIATIQPFPRLRQSQQFGFRLAAIGAERGL